MLASSTNAEFIRNYAANNYTFVGDSEGQLVAKLIFRHIAAETIVDLGCGPVHHILALFIPYYTNAILIDKCRECIDFIADASTKEEPSQSQLAAIFYRKRYLRDMSICNLEEQLLTKQVFSKIKQMICGDVLIKYEHLRQQAGAVIQVGCFGALNTKEEFETAVSNAGSYLKPGGKLLMVNWFQNIFTERPLGFNGRVSSQLSLQEYCESLEKAGLIVVTQGKVNNISTYSKEMGYDYIVYAVGVKK